MAEVDQYLKEIWWLTILRGIALMLFGFAAIFWPGLTLALLIVIFAVYVLISGVVNIVTSVISLSQRQLWFLTLLVGVLEVGVGVYALRHPAITAETLVLLIGIVFLVRGILEIIAAFDDSGRKSKGLFVVAGVLSVIAGIFILSYPGVGSLAFVWVLGVYALISGPLLIAVALEGKNAAEGARR